MRRAQFIFFPDEIRQVYAGYAGYNAFRHLFRHRFSVFRYIRFYKRWGIPPLITSAWTSKVRNIKF